MKKRKAPGALDTPTPGCDCTSCRNLQELSRSGTPDGREQAGRMQQFAAEQGWSDGGSDSPAEGKFGRLRGNEAADRREREEQGVSWLPAAYRYLIGPHPQCLPADTDAARSYLTKIMHAIEVGGWTRSEWARLYRLRDKWQARAAGNDPRFNLVGNRTGGLDKQDTANVKMQRIVENMKRELDHASKIHGD